MKIILIFIILSLLIIIEGLVIFMLAKKIFGQTGYIKELENTIKAQSKVYGAFNEIDKQEQNDKNSINYGSMDDRLNSAVSILQNNKRSRN